MRINNREIGTGFAPFIIAEMSANHNGNIDNAFKIIAAAKLAGADAVKLQTYRPDTITLNSDAEEFQIHGGLWDGKTLYQLYEEAHTPWEWHKPLSPPDRPGHSTAARHAACALKHLPPWKWRARP